MFTEILTVHGHDLCRVHLKPAACPVGTIITIDNNGQNQKKTQFLVRFNTAIADEGERQKYIAQRWPN